MKIGVRDPSLPDAALEQILVGARLVGLPVLLAKDVAVRVVARILPLQGHLDRLVVQKVLVQPVHDVDRPAGVVRFRGFYRFHAGGGRF